MKMEKADKINRMTHHGAKPKHSDGASWSHQLGSAVGVRSCNHTCRNQGRGTICEAWPLGVRSGSVDSLGGPIRIDKSPNPQSQKKEPAEQGKG